MERLRVSIVIVNWKTPRLLKAALRSVLADPESNRFEIIVVDNNSGDGSVEMLRRDFPMVHTIANTENVGFAKACNQVIPNALGKYVLLLNPDTQVVDCGVTKLAHYMDIHHECGAVGPKVLNPDGSLQLACRRSFPTPQAALYRLTYLSRLFPKNEVLARYNVTNVDPNSELEVDALSGSCMMVRKTAIDKIGLMDEAIFMFGEDIDWCWRLKEAGWQVRYFPGAVVYHYHGASSRFRRVRSTVNLHVSMTVFYRKYFASRHRLPLNLLIYIGIWLRGGLSIVIALLRYLLPARPAGVFTGDVDGQPTSDISQISHSVRALPDSELQ
jgi:GT2 family glycosyltransferase